MNEVATLLEARRSEYACLVLLVDDQPIIGEAVRRMLIDQPDIDLHYCADPGQALREAEEIRPTVILQDLVLPGTDGLSLLAEYRARPSLRDVPVIVLSTREDPSVKRDSFKAGASDYLVKLPDPIELVARIRHHSRAYLNQVQRDEAYRALRESQQKLMETNLELQRLSTQDALTGLSNRRQFDACLEAEWLRSTREAKPLSLLMIDVDDFKAYNDGYGHPAGDEVLRRVGGLLAGQAKRSTDLAARYGGEEFAVILACTPLDGALTLARQLCEAVLGLGLTHRGSRVAGCVTISIGVASRVPARGQGPSELLKAADLALYDAKESGKNRCSTRGLAS